MSNFPESSSELPPHPSEVQSPGGSSPGGMEPPLRPSRWTARILFLVVVAVVLGVLGYYEFPRERARWYQAQALEEFYKGETDEALASINRSIELNPDDSQSYFVRAQVQTQRKAYADALKDVEHSIEMGVGDEYQALMLRAEIHQHLEQYEAALEDWRLARKPAQEQQRFSEDTWKNGTAYVRAVGDFDLQAALNDVESAVMSLGGDFRIDQRGGILLYKLEKPQQAVRLWSQAAEMAGKESAQSEKRLEVVRQSQEFLGQFVDAQPFERKAEAESSTLAQLHFYRSLAYEAAGDTEQAEQDRKQAGDKEEQKSWKQMLDSMGDDSLADLSQAATAYAAYIDTRGYLHYRLGDNEAALRDLTTAVDLAEAANKYLKHSPHYRSLVGSLSTPEEAAYAEHRQEMSLAVLHYHRAEVLEKLGRSDEAKAELDRVRELGFEPGPDLF